MSGPIKKKISVTELFKEQVATNFVVLAILIGSSLFQMGELASTSPAMR